MAKLTRRVSRTPASHRPPEVFGTTMVGERGQVVIPAEARRKLRLKHGDKLIVIAKDGALGLIRVDAIRTLMVNLNRHLGKLR